MIARLKNPRVLLAAGIVFAAVFAVLVLSRAGDDTNRQGDGSPAGREAPLRVVHAKLTLEQLKRPDSSQLELLVSLPGPQLNTLTLTGGESRVVLSCFDRGGELTVREPVVWPLVEEPGYAPHIHQPADQALLDAIGRCRLSGPGMDFDGRVTGKLPLAE